MSEGEQLQSPPPPELSPTVEELESRFPQAVTGGWEQDGVLRLEVAAQGLLDLCRELRDAPEYAFDFLADLTACELDGLKIVYLLFSIPHSRFAWLHLAVDGERPAAPTLSEIWPGANWFEREVYDLFGVRFEGHPDLRRIMLPDQWESHPLRRSVPLEPLVYPPAGGMEVGQRDSLLPSEPGGEP